MATIVVSSIGSGRDYSTPQAWDDAAPANLVTADQVWKGEMYAEGGGTNGEWTIANLNIGGSTADATRYKWLTAAAGQSFADHANKATNALRYNNANGVGLRTTASYSSALILAENNVRVDRLQFDRASSGGPNFVSNGGGTGHVLDRVILRQNGAAVAVTSMSLVINSLIEIKANASAASMSLTGASFRNCTFIGNGSSTCFTTSYSSGLILKNCALFGWTNDVSNEAHWDTGASSNNATDLAAIIGSAGQTSLTTANQFVSLTGGSEDYRLKSGNALLGAGVRDQVYTLDTDIIGRARSTATPSIGAWDEPPPAGTAYSDTVASAAASTAGQSIDDELSQSIDVGAMAFAGQTINDTHVPASGAYSDTVTAATALATGQTINETYTPASVAYADTVTAAAMSASGQTINDSYVPASNAYSDTVSAAAASAVGQNIGANYVSGNISISWVRHFLRKRFGKRI